MTQILEAPKHPYTAGLLKALPQFAGRGTKLQHPHAGSKQSATLIKFFEFEVGAGYAPFRLGFLGKWIAALTG